MRERAQASVETIALMTVAAALVAALALGIVKLAPPLASAIGQVISGASRADSPVAPALDGLERALLDAATGAAVEGPTLLDVRTSLRLRLPRASADAAFGAVLQPLVARALAAESIAMRPSRVTIVDRAGEDAWLHHRFYPSRIDRAAHLTASLAGIPGAVFSLAEDIGLVASEPADGIEPGHAAGDVLLQFGVRQIVLRRRAGAGLIVVADRYAAPSRAGE